MTQGPLERDAARLQEAVSQAIPKVSVVDTFNRTTVKVGDSPLFDVEFSYSTTAAEKSAAVLVLRAMADFTNAVQRDVDSLGRSA